MIVTRLVGDPDAQERKLKVDVVNGVVTLRGVVASENERAEATRMSKETEGVKRVNNLLMISATP
jgi:osmotically-inducible protein OsmY